MERKIEELSPTKRKITVTVDEATWKEELKKAFHKLASKVEIKGFRAGKAPEHLLREHVRQETIYQEAIDKTYPLVMKDTLTNIDFKIAIQPKVSITKLSDTELEMTLECVLVPSVELGDYKAVKIPAEAPSVTEEEVENAIKKLLENEAELVTVEREAKKGDTLRLDFEGFLPEENGDLKPFEGGKAESYELELGSNTFIPGFEDQLLGVKPGEDREVNVTFPTAYVKELAGKKAVFKTHTHEVKEKQIPELTEETIKDLGIEGVKTAEELRNHEKETLLKQKLGRAEAARYAKIVDEIAAKSTFAIDEEILVSEAKRLEEQAKKDIEGRGLTWEQYLQLLGKKEEDVAADYKKEAERDLRRFLVESKVIELEKIEVSDADIADLIKKDAEQYKMKEEDVKKIVDQHLDNFKSNILAEKVRKHLLETCR